MQPRIAHAWRKAAKANTAGMMSPRSRPRGYLTPSRDAAIKRHAAADHRHVAGLPDQTDRVRSRGGSMVCAGRTLFSPNAVDQRHRDAPTPGIAVIKNIAHRILPYRPVWYDCALALVNTVVIVRKPNDRSTLREGLARTRGEDTDVLAVHGAEA